MARSATTAPDPALERLREVAERIRQRAAAARQRRPVRALAPVVVPAPSGPPPPPHWADGPDRGTDDGSR